MNNKRKFLALLLAFTIFTGINSEYINAAPKQVKKCIKKGKVQTCTYKNKKGKVTKKVITTYRKNGKKQKRAYNIYQGKLIESKTYHYNKDGVLKSNKRGKARRVIQTYRKDVNMKKDFSTAYYNKNGKIYKETGGINQSGSSYTKDTKFRKNNKRLNKTVKEYHVFLARKTVYNYNKQGQAKSNKHGKATRTVYSYQYNHDTNKNKLVRKQTAEYNSKGKLVKVKVVKY